MLAYHLLMQTMRLNSCLGRIDAEKAYAAALARGESKTSAVAAARDVYEGVGGSPLDSADVAAYISAKAQALDSYRQTRRLGGSKKSSQSALASSFSGDTELFKEVERLACAEFCPPLRNHECGAGRVPHLIKRGCCYKKVCEKVTKLGNGDSKNLLQQGGSVGWVELAGTGQADVASRDPVVIGHVSIKDTGVLFVDRGTNVLAEEMSLSASQSATPIKGSGIVDVGGLLCDLCVVIVAFSLCDVLSFIRRCGFKLHAPCNSIHLVTHATHTTLCDVLSFIRRCGFKLHAPCNSIHLVTHATHTTLCDVITHHSGTICACHITWNQAYYIIYLCHKFMRS